MKPPRRERPHGTQNLGVRWLDTAFPSEPSSGAARPVRSRKPKRCPATALQNLLPPRSGFPSPVGREKVPQADEGTGVGRGEGSRKVRCVLLLAALLLTTTFCLLTSGTTAYDAQDIVINGATVSIDGPHAFHSLLLTHGAVLTYLPCTRRCAKTASPLSKVLRVQPAPFHDALQRADGNRLVAMHGHDHLPSVRVTPLLMAAPLAREHEVMPAEHAHDLLCAAYWKMLAQGRDTSSSFVPFLSLSFDGSNHNASASCAFWMASASVSPAEAQPGNSGNTADHLLASGSNSMNSRNFMRRTVASFSLNDKHAVPGRTMA